MSAMFSEPYEVINPAGTARGVLVCDHASNTIPAKLDGLGLEKKHLSDHIAWDIGAGWVTRQLSERLNMRGVVCGYSRLLIDCNRQLDDPSSIPPVSDGVPVPGNQHLTQQQRDDRVSGIFKPYHNAISATINQWFKDQGQDGVDSGGDAVVIAPTSPKPVIFSIHSMTPKLKVVGEHRPWEVSVLWHSDRSVADALLEYLCKREDEHGYCVGNNEPYSGKLIPGYTTPTHGLARGLPHVIIEIRNDKLQDEESAAYIVDLLAGAFEHAMDVCCCSGPKFDADGGADVGGDGKDTKVAGEAGTGADKKPLSACSQQVCD
ncbi:N-formylglutamate amidohydrolase [Salpingoeca rosetta]|uniref:N-formylglutamate amidohydrolase n=1 Tax=Salpingoeca rosetta (strain ATCC 50818 / BSB-021) TaxID=946362 RepID=F2UQ51_SALR5|nr:N-formylglutamate amidohydrolase [Salpingoeca rosetta]EGD79719.1 N-formylglutamate amidohydrolase [Salpingoeca rosetta]|eukprot:XP_004988668.1 N-formylglutamate amidohydrolase [Salpingoeca rosetta]